MDLNTLKDLYVEQLRDLHSAESQLVEALPDMVEAASHQKLKDAFQSHLEETRRQRDRLDQIFEQLGESPKGEKCKAMEGLIKEAKDLASKNADADVLDAGLIASAQRVEHYEIAAYGTVRTYADMLGRNDDRRLLEKTLEEEKDADETLNDLAIELVNPEAAAA